MNFRLLGIFFALLVFRTYYGLNLDFWHEDEKHVYLLGLEWYSTHAWPYFGADVIHTDSRISGPLQSFLVGLPFHLLKLPEAPFLFLNILSLLGILLFATYIQRKLNIAKELAFLWLATLPWTLEISTHVYNPSYLLLPVVVFFVGLFELSPRLSSQWWQPRYAFFLMGLSVGCITQIHLSWPLLLPFIALSFWWQRRQIFGLGSIFALGFAIPVSLVVPTLLSCGVNEVVRAGVSNSGFNWENAGLLINDLVRLVSFPAYETAMFIGESFEERKEILLRFWHLLPFFVTLTLIGLVQVPFYLYTWYRIWRSQHVFGSAVVLLMLFAFVESYGIFLVSSRPPISRNFYLLFPVFALGGLAALTFPVLTVKRVVALKALIILSIVYHGLLAQVHHRGYADQSIFSNRDLVQRSIDTRSPELFETPRYPNVCASVSPDALKEQGPK